MTPSTKSPTPSSPTTTTTTTTSSLDPATLDNACIVDIHHFTTTLSNIKSKNLSPDLLPSIITHYASKCLPELSSSSSSSSPVSTTTSAWLEKRVLIESLVSILPKERDSMPPTFLLRLLRTASMVGVGAVYLDEIENRVGWQLEKASLEEVLIPGFGHTCRTLLDVGLMVRLVSKFLTVEEEEGARSGVAMVKVAKLVDSYLAEVAIDGELLVTEFERLATSMPSHSRATDDGLYRAVDTYIKAHPCMTKQDKAAIIRLIDPRKLSSEASLHAIHNDRLPVRSVIQILFSEQSKLNRISDWSLGSFTGPRSLSPALDGPGRCPSKRELVMAQHHETLQLKEDVARLQTQFRALQAQIDRLGPEKKQKKKGLLRWTNFLLRNSDSVVDRYEIGHEHHTSKTTPLDVKKAKMVNGIPRWRRNSMS